MVHITQIISSKFLGLSANAGRVFDFSDNTLFIKPFAGVNYYSVILHLIQKMVLLLKILIL